MKINNNIISTVWDDHNLSTLNVKNLSHLAY